MPRSDAARLVTIDFGKKTSGIALWSGSILARSFEVHAPGGDPSVMAMQIYLAGTWFAPEAAMWVGENMRDYRAKGARKKDLQGLRDVALRALLVATEGRHQLLLVPASRWKAGTSKDVCHRRILAHLNGREVEAITPPTKETLDAVGIGLWKLERLGRGMATPRGSRARARTRQTSTPR